jgi:phenylacetic acid degradation operon negative regulatory protein
MTPQRNKPAAPEAGLLERPLAARSVIGSLLLGVHPPRLPGARIVEWCTRFGIAEGTARVALSRMVDRGELTATAGVYELAGRVRDLQPAQDWSLDPAPRDWDGDWRVAVVDGTARDATARAALRSAMRRLRFAELREGVWTRPDNLPPESAPAESWALVASQCAWWTGSPEDDAASLATRLFAPGDWAARARVLSKRVGRLTDRLDAGDDGSLRPGFVAGAATLQHARRDPILPGELLPSDWPGPALRTGYARFQRAFASTLAATLGR